MVRDLADRQRRQRGFESRLRQNLDRVGVEIGEQIAAGAGIWPAEQRVVDSHRGRNGLRRRDPMQRRLDLAAIGRVAAFCC